MKITTNVLLMLAVINVNGGGEMVSECEAGVVLTVDSGSVEMCKNDVVVGGGVVSGEEVNGVVSGSVEVGGVDGMNGSVGVGGIGGSGGVGVERGGGVGGMNSGEDDRVVDGVVSGRVGVEGIGGSVEVGGVDGVSGSVGIERGGEMGSGTGVGDVSERGVVGVRGMNGGRGGMGSGTGVGDVSERGGVEVGEVNGGRGGVDSGTGVGDVKGTDGREGDDGGVNDVSGSGGVDGGVGVDEHKRSGAVITSLVRADFGRTSDYRTDRNDERNESGAISDVRGRIVDDVKCGDKSNERGVSDGSEDGEINKSDGRSVSEVDESDMRDGGVRVDGSEESGRAGVSGMRRSVEVGGNERVGGDDVSGRGGVERGGRVGIVGGSEVRVGDGVNEREEVGGVGGRSGVRVGGVGESVVRVDGSVVGVGGVDERSGIGRGVDERSGVGGVGGDGGGVDVRGGYGDDTEGVTASFEHVPELGGLDVVMMGFIRDLIRCHEHYVIDQDAKKSFMAIVSILSNAAIDCNYQGEEHKNLANIKNLIDNVISKWGLMDLLHQFQASRDMQVDSYLLWLKFISGCTEMLALLHHTFIAKGTIDEDHVLSFVENLNDVFFNGREQVSVRLLSKLQKSMNGQDISVDLLHFVQSYSICKMNEEQKQDFKSKNVESLIDSLIALPKEIEVIKSMLSIFQIKCPKIQEDLKKIIDTMEGSEIIKEIVAVTKAKYQFGDATKTGAQMIGNGLMGLGNRFGMVSPEAVASRQAAREDDARRKMRTNIQKKINVESLGALQWLYVSVAHILQFLADDQVSQAELHEVSFAIKHVITDKTAEILNALSVIKQHDVQYKEIIGKRSELFNVFRHLGELIRKMEIELNIDIKSSTQVHDIYHLGLCLFDQTDTTLSIVESKMFVDLLSRVLLGICSDTFYESFGQKIDVQDRDDMRTDSSAAMAAVGLGSMSSPRGLGVRTDSSAAMAAVGLGSASSLGGMGVRTGSSAAMADAGLGSIHRSESVMSSVVCKRDGVDMGIKSTTSIDIRSRSDARDSEINQLRSILRNANFKMSENVQVYQCLCEMMKQIRLQYLRDLSVQEEYIREIEQEYNQDGYVIALLLDQMICKSVMNFMMSRMEKRTSEPRVLQGSSDGSAKTQKSLRIA